MSCLQQGGEEGKARSGAAGAAAAAEGLACQYLQRPQARPPPYHAGPRPNASMPLQLRFAALFKNETAARNQTYLLTMAVGVGGNTWAGGPAACCPAASAGSAAQMFTARCLHPPTPPFYALSNRPGPGGTRTQRRLVQCDDLRPACRVVRACVHAFVCKRVCKGGRARGRGAPLPLCRRRAAVLDCCLPCPCGALPPGCRDTVTNFQTPWTDPAVSVGLGGLPLTLRGACVCVLPPRRRLRALLPPPMRPTPPHPLPPTPSRQGGTLDIQSALHHYIDRGGVPPAQINLGLAAYGRSWTLATWRKAGLGAPAYAPGAAAQCTGERGFLAWSEVKAMIAEGAKVRTHAEPAAAVGCMNGRRGPGVNPGPTITPPRNPFLAPPLCPRAWSCNPCARRSQSTTRTRWLPTWCWTTSGWRSTCRRHAGRERGHARMGQSAALVCAPVAGAWGACTWLTCTCIPRPTHAQTIFLKMQKAKEAGLGGVMVREAGRGGGGGAGRQGSLRERTHHHARRRCGLPTWMTLTTASCPRSRTFPATPGPLCRRRCPPRRRPRRRSRPLRPSR